MQGKPSLLPPSYFILPTFEMGEDRMKRLAVGLIFAVGLLAQQACLGKPANGRTGAAEIPSALAKNRQCLMCHSAPQMKRSSLHIEIERFAGSAHGKLRCIDCHRDLSGRPLPHPTAATVDCAGCHRADNPYGAPDVKSRIMYEDSAHGQAVARGDKDAPRCFTCHGDHYILPPGNEASSVSRANIPATCGRCHSDPGIVRRHNIEKGEVLKFYRQSVHGQALAAKGLSVTAVCTDCHGVHDIKIGSDPKSSVSRPHIPATCGKCHGGIYKEYQAGIHGQAFARGAKEAPVCTDCHGEHTIRAPAEATSSVNPIHIAKTCSHCHENVKIERKFGLPAHRLSTYMDSYHGVANKYGDITVANCATCHGAHEILPSSDPHSPINKRNLPKTCGRCHPGAGKNFAKGSVHLLPSPKKDQGVYWVRRFYQVFIFGLVAAFVGYIFLDLLSRRRKRAEGASGREGEEWRE